MSFALSSVNLFSRIIPLALLTYAVARFIDGRDGTHGPSLAWDVGHWAFLAAFVMFGVVVAVTNGVMAATGRRVAGVVAGTVGMVGVILFLWVILGDLFPRVDEVYDLPDLLMNLGPLAFMVGLVTPLAVLAWNRARSLPRVAPLAAMAAFVLLAADLNFLAVAAGLFAIALWRLPQALTAATQESGTAAVH